MQEWNWARFNVNGTIDLDVSDDPENPRWLHIGRAKIKHLRDYGMRIEEADDLVMATEAEIRVQAGYTDEVKDMMLTASTSGIEALTSPQMLLAADGATIERAYTSLLQRFLLSDDNPYPAIWISILNDADLTTPILGDDDEGNLPPFCFGQETIQAVVSHWQSVPLHLGVAQASPISNGQTGPNRATRRAATKPTRTQ
jgi:hypothetical protein